jgi:hypothetical protein
MVSPFNRVVLPLHLSELTPPMRVLNLVDKDVALATDASPPGDIGNSMFVTAPVPGLNN